MDVLMNGLLMAATLFAGGYCWVLARRVNDLKSLDKGLGGAIVTLTRQVELARATLEEARAATGDSRQELDRQIARADAVAGQLRLLLATVDREPRRVPPAAEPVRRAVPEPESDLADEAVRAVAPAEPAPAAAPRTPLELDEIVPEAGVDDAADAAVPKPRALPPIENPLRRRGRDDPAPRNEDELIEALTALAGNGGR